MSVSNLTNTTWKFEANPQLDTALSVKSINFKPEGQSSNATSIRCRNDGQYGFFIDYSNSAVYSTKNGPLNNWANKRVIHIIGGQAVEDAELIAFLERYATQITDTYYYVSKSDMESVANAIRTKGGTSATLKFPQGFIDAIDAL